MSESRTKTWFDSAGAEMASATVRRLGPGEGPSLGAWSMTTLRGPPLLRDKWYVKRWGDEAVSAGPFDTSEEALAEIDQRKKADE